MPLPTQPSPRPGVLGHAEAELCAPHAGQGLQCAAGCALPALLPRLSLPAPVPSWPGEGAARLLWPGVSLLSRAGFPGMFPLCSQHPARLSWG